MAPPGLTALGAKGSVRDRLTPPGRVEGSRPREVYSTAPLARWAPFRALFFMPPLAAKNFTTGLSPIGKPYNRPTGEEMHLPLVAGATTFPPQAVAL